MKRKFEVRALVRENVNRLKPYSSARDEFKKGGSENFAFMDANENPFGSGLNRYPDPKSDQLRNALSSLKGIDPTQIMVGNGSDEVLDLLFRVFCEPGRDNIFTLPPTYGMYKVLANINAVENREVLLTKTFQPDVRKVLQNQDHNSKLLFLCSPNNPTGNSFEEDLVEELLMNFNGLVVIDEAYIDFSNRESWLKKLSEYGNLVVTQTLSKAYGLAGIRLGICYSSPQIIALLNKIKPPYNINTLTQEQALEKLKEPDLLKKEINLILKEKGALYKALLEVKFVKKIFPSDANFLLVKVDDATQRYNEMIRRGVVLRNRSSQPGCENTLRITVGTEEENKRLINCCKEIEAWDAKYSL